MSDNKNPQPAIKTTVQVDPSKIIKVEVTTQKNSYDPSKIHTLNNQTKK